MLQMNHTPQKSSQTVNTQSPSINEIQEWIVNRLAAELRVERERINVEHPISSLGIDSVQVVSVLSSLEDWCGFRFSENPLDDHPTTEMLARFAAQLITEKQRRSSGE